MSSVRPQDRKSLCRFTFADGRQCRTPRSPGHSHLCSDHAHKDSRARAADNLARELSYLSSGEYLSACDPRQHSYSSGCSTYRTHTKGPRSPRSQSLSARNVALLRISWCQFKDPLLSPSIQTTYK
jgi:hypothetical protein